MSPKEPRPVCGDRAAAGIIDYGKNQYSLDNVAALRAQASRQLQRQRLVERIHCLGARAVFELLDQLERDHGLGSDLDQQLQRFAGLDPELLRAVGADRFASAPMRLVGDGR